MPTIENYLVIKPATFLPPHAPPPPPPPATSQMQMAVQAIGSPPTPITKLIVLLDPTGSANGTGQEVEAVPRYAQIHLRSSDFASFETHLNDPTCTVRFSYSCSSVAGNDPITSFQPSYSYP